MGGLNDHGWLDEELTYEEFKTALEPYCKPVGRYPERNASSMVLEGTVWREAWALDLRRIDKGRELEPVKPVDQQAGPAAAVPDRSFGERPCPNCGLPVDRRAGFCLHCKKTVAHHVRCPHCQEARVPDDLDVCWKCGLKMRDEEQIDCPRCLSFRGYPEDFPCSVCGFDLAQQVEEVEVSGETPGSVPPVDPFPGASSGNGGSPAPAAVDEPAADLVQCPTCYSLVNTGPRCSICSGLLDAN